MIVVLSANRGDFLRWAYQFAEHDPSNRQVCTFPSVRAGDRHLLRKVEQAYGQAAQPAGDDGTVIISVGHGGSRANTGAGLAAGMADLVPNRALRINQANVFYGRSASDATIVAEAAGIPERRCRRLLADYDLDESETRAGRRRPSPPDPDASHEWAMCSGAPGARSRLLIRRCYDSIGRIFRHNQVSNVVFLSCNIGNATRFVDKIANDWGVPVTAYQRRVGVIQDDGNKYRVYLFGDRPGRGTNTERGRTEIPDQDTYDSGSN